jgi:hypothetical protein
VVYGSFADNLFKNPNTYHVADMRSVQGSSFAKKNAEQPKKPCFFFFIFCFIIHFWLIDEFFLSFQLIKIQECLKLECYNAIAGQFSGLSLAVYLLLDTLNLYRLD